MVTDGYQAASDVFVAPTPLSAATALAQSIRDSSILATRGIKSALQCTIPQSNTSRGVADDKASGAGCPSARNARINSGVA